MSPKAARAGQYKRLSASGVMATNSADISMSVRDRLPMDWIAASCNPITKAAPMTAATICAANRVRRGPSVLNSRIVSATASAMAARLTAASTP